MRKSIILTIGLCVLAACKGSGNNGNGDKGDMAGNNNGGGNFTVLSATVTLAAGQGGCANGGVQVNIGLDNGDGGGVARDGTLQDGEIDTNKVICNAAPGNTTTLTLQTPLGLGNMHCMFGGTQIDYGLDNGEGGGTAGNGTLEKGEIDGTTYACLSKPSNLLVVTTPLFAGDPQCEFGGQLITSGLDDGAPSGTAGNGTLDPGEDTTTIPHCNAAPDELFPPPTGTAGTATIDVHGANSAGLGTSSYAGTAGSIRVAAYGGPAPTSVEAYKAGSVTVDTNVPEPSFTDGAHRVDISGDTKIPLVIAPTAGLHVRVDLEAAPAPWGWPIYDGDTLVSSVHVLPGGKLTFVTTDPAVYIALSGDLLNEGTVTAAMDIEGSLNTTELFLQCHNLINKGAIDLRALTEGATAGHLEVWAVSGTGGQIWNGPTGVIRSDGWDTTDVAAPAATYSNWMALTSSGTFFNGGSILTTGGKNGTDVNQYGIGNGIAIRTLNGNIVHSGTIDASGQRGQVGNGGIILFYNGALDLDAIEPEWSTPTLPKDHPALADRTIFGPGAFIGTGSVKSTGGHVGDASQSAGSGGQIIVRMVGGAVTASTIFDVSGGAIDTGNYHLAGSGGRIVIADFTWVGLDGRDEAVFPSGIALSGSLLATGGAVNAGEGAAGDGGEINVVLDLMLTGSDGGDIGGVEYWPSYSLSPSVFAAATTPARIQLLGYGGNLHAEGGSTAYFGGRAGLIAFTNDVCNWGSDNCALTHIGPRLTAHDVDLVATGGDAPNGYFGSGGKAKFRMSNQSNFLPSTIDASRILTKGAIDVSAGSSYRSTEQDTPYISYFCESCDVLVSGDLTGNGANLSYDNETTDFGGEPGYFDIRGFSVTLQSQINFNGGEGADSHGYGIESGISAYYATNTGSITAATGSVYLTTILSFTNTGEVNVDAPDEYHYGGYINFAGATITNTGMAHARGYSGTTCSDGGEIDVNATTFNNSGTLDASGGSATREGGSAQGCTGGALYLYGTGGEQKGSALARGGVASSTGVESSAVGGNGGYIEQYGPNQGTLDASGGDATDADSLNGGDGGDIEFYGVGATNAGNALAKGGNDGGSGGYVYFEPMLATNTGCVDVSAGVGGIVGQIDPDTTPNMCGG